MSEYVNSICQGWWAREISVDTGPARKNCGVPIPRSRRSAWWCIG